VTEAMQRLGRELLARYPQPSGALMPLIDLILERHGVCDADAAGWIATLTGLPEAAVLGIASSRQSRSTDDTVHVCTGLSCRLMGAEEVLDRLRERLADRVAGSACLGACSAAPVLERGGRVFDGLTWRRIDGLIAGDAATAEED
jgi:NADH:ubiquinone oxidoreductase subunit E